MFTITPPKNLGTEKHAEELRMMQKNARTCDPCWLCGARLSIRKYADHMERHRAEGWKHRDKKASTKKMKVFAEWQQQDEQVEGVEDVA